MIHHAREKDVGWSRHGAGFAERRRVARPVGGHVLCQEHHVQVEGTIVRWQRGPTACHSMATSARASTRVERGLVALCHATSRAVTSPGSALLSNEVFQVSVIPVQMIPP